MFAHACELASYFTRPVVISTRLSDGSINCEVGAFVILNEEGWIITAAHIFNSKIEFNKHDKERREYQEKVKKIESDTKLNAKQKRKKINKLQPIKNLILNHSFWWGDDNLKIINVKILQEADLAIGLLEPYKADMVTYYPTLKNPAFGLKPGTSLCRLGFPFYNIDASYDEKKDSFTLAAGTLPIPLFPIEGIYTREGIVGKTSDGKYELKFLETSSPGLRGQSGGPIFDVKGTVCAIQSRTAHLPLGFSPKVKKDGREVEEHQFLNVGWGIHFDLIIAFLNDNNIRFRLSDD